MPGSGLPQYGAFRRGCEDRRGGKTPKSQRRPRDGPAADEGGHGTAGICRKIPIMMLWIRRFADLSADAPAGIRPSVAFKSDLRCCRAAIRSPQCLAETG